MSEPAEGRERQEVVVAFALTSAGAAVALFAYLPASWSMYERLLTCGLVFSVLTLVVVRWPRFAADLVLRIASLPGILVLCALVLVALWFRIPEPAVQSADPSDRVTVSECSGWEVRDFEHPDTRLLAAGLTGRSSDAIGELLETARHEPDVFMTLWRLTPQGQAHPVERSQILSDECMSEFAQDLWYQMKGAYDSAEVLETEAPSAAFDTGIHEGQLVRSEQAGITGDRQATRVAFKGHEGRPVYFLRRTANPVLLATCTSGEPFIPLPVGPTYQSDITTNRSSTSETAVAPTSDDGSSPCVD